MRIVCPACETAYDVPDTVLTPGRALRCARCRSEWIPLAEQPAAEPAMEEAAPHSEVPAAPLVRVASDPPAGARVVVIAGWLVSLIVLGGLAYAAINWRQPVEKAWPPSRRAYAWLGYE